VNWKSLLFCPQNPITEVFRSFPLPVRFESKQSDKNIIFEQCDYATLKVPGAPLFCKVCNAVTRQPNELELLKPSTDSASLLVKIEKNVFRFRFGVFWG